MKNARSVTAELGVATPLLGVATAQLGVATAQLGDATAVLNLDRNAESPCQTPHPPPQDGT